MILPFVFTFDLFLLNQSHILHFSAAWNSPTSTLSLQTVFSWTSLITHLPNIIWFPWPSPPKLLLKMPPITCMFPDPMVPFLFSDVWVFSGWAVQPPICICRIDHTFLLEISSLISLFYCFTVSSYLFVTRTPYSLFAPSLISYCWNSIFSSHLTLYL